MKTKEFKLISIILIAILSLAIFGIFATQISFAQENNTQYYTGYYQSTEILGDPCGSLHVSDNDLKTTSVTILMHGQNGSAKNWSNDGSSFIYDSESMIEKLRDENLNSNVYATKNEGGKYKVVPLLRNDYARYNANFNNTNSINYIDTTKSSIIVFESSGNNTGAAHALAFAELHKFIDNVLYDYKYTTGCIPKINLIGHSRGGILNMMYANTHPHFVDSIFSLGTPYKGTQSGTMLDVLNINETSITCGSGQDIINPTLQYELQQNWTNAYSQNSKIKAYAIGGVMHINILHDVINDLRGMHLSNDKMQYLCDLLDALVTKIETKPLLSNFLIDVLNIAQNIASAACDVFAGTNSIEASNAIYNVVNNFKLARNTERFFEYDVDKNAPIFEDDGMVHLDSQLANGFIGFARFSKVYDKDYEYKDKVSVGTFIAGHNLQSRDPELIKYITDRISLEASDTIFELQNIPGGLKILGVKYNATIDDHIYIPSSINGKAVKEIGERAFDNLSGRFDDVRKLSIPSTLTNLGYQSLRSLNLSSIELNGNTRFVLSNNALYNSQMNRLLFYIPLSASATFEVPNSITNIEPYTFYGAINLKTITLPNNLGVIGNMAFANSGIQNINYSNNNLTFIGHGIFENTPYLEYSDFIVFNGDLLKYNGTQTEITANMLPSTVMNIGYEAFAGSNISKIELPSRIQKIDDYAFLGSELNSIILNNNIRKVGKGALANCSNLNEVIVTFTNPNIIDFDAFAYNDDIAIKVPYYYMDDFIAHENLRSQANNIVAQNTTILFNANGGNAISPMNNVPYYSLLGEMPIPVKNGYNFVGWYLSDNSNFYYTEGAIWDQYAEESTLLAKWSPKTYNISYHLNGGINGNNPTSYTIEDIVAFNDAQKAGYNFDGWFYDSNYSNRVIEIANATGDINLYAKFTPKTYVINYNLNGDNAEITNTNTTVTFGQGFDFDIPTRVGYTFKGWTNLDGSKYYTDEQGRHKAVWSIAENTTVYAKWSIEKYELKITTAKGDLWLGNSGLTGTKELVEFGSGLDIINAIYNFKKSIYGYEDGQIFEKFNYNKNQINWTVVPDLGDHEAIVIITPVWKNEVHKIIFKSLVDNVDYSDIECEYNKIISLPIVNVVKEGYTFGGWYTYRKINNSIDTLINNIEYLEEFNETRMPDLTKIVDINDENQRLNCQSNGSVTLVAKWIPNEYKILFDTDGGDPLNYKNVLYNSNVTGLPSAYKEHFNFVRWEYNGNTFANGSKYVYAHDITVKAIWTPKNYSISYSLGGGTLPANSPTLYTYVTDTFSLPKPSKFGYQFNGWELNGRIISDITKGSYGNITLIARWKGVERAYTQAGDYTISDEVIIVNFANAGALTQMKFYITPDVKEITFVSGGIAKSYKSIIVEKRTNPLYMRLKNVNIFGHYNTAAINALQCSDLTLESVGANYIRSGTVTSSLKDGAALKSQNMEIIGDELYITGSFAFAKDDKGNGLDGDHGIFGAGKLKIKAKRVEATGGIATSGNNAGDGADRTEVPGKAAKGKAGSTGYTGYNGGNGFKGGNGGYGVFYLGDIEVASGSVLIGKGGDGGDGGNGGDGGKGGRGGEGGDAAFLVYGADGGRGGDGGHGGDGGNGGVGGEGIAAVSVSGGGSWSSTNGQAGLGGKGGNGGQGGQGGLGGWTLKGDRRYATGAQGAYGYMGEDGSGR